MHRIAAAFIVLLVTIPAMSHAQSPVATAPKTVLVTGASTGIGRKITERLAAAAKPGDVEVWYPQGMGHVQARNKMRAEYAQRVTAFFKRTLAPRG